MFANIRFILIGVANGQLFNFNIYLQGMFHAKTGFFFNIYCINNEREFIQDGDTFKYIVFANHPFICLIQNNYSVKLNSDILLSSKLFYNLGQISNIVNPT